MHNSFSTMALTSLVLHLLLLLSSLHVLTNVARATPGADSLAGEANSISPKAYLVHYWNKQITNNLPKPPILFSKASPLTATSATIFAELVAKGAISDHLLSFCEEAQLLCFVNSSSSGVAATQVSHNIKWGPSAPGTPLLRYNCGN
ncbi:polygalacturonase non-catalytic subunit AroGP2 [Eucalyptus grandis]|uniref:polygalacturonase non-catalytic subunit AroGP2 n=1 Tax=Eucalyptus grandis TaxID=71139 RepID=UPI00192EAF28|nr:polygalacturonase non-catalytic subunit AroGP2 [Eucalyptus grandis]